MRKPSIVPSSLKAGLPSLVAFVGALVVATQDGSVVTTNEWLIATLAALTAAGGVYGLDYSDKKEYEKVLTEEEDHYADATVTQERAYDSLLAEQEARYEAALAEQEQRYSDALAEQDERYSAQYDAWAEGYDRGETFEDGDEHPAHEADEDVPVGTDYA